MRQLGIIEDGSVLVVNGVISSVGPTRRIENLAEARGAEEINATGRVVLPGFVDSHTRLINAPGRLSGFQLPQTRDIFARSVHESELQWANMNYLRLTPGKLLESNAQRTVHDLLRHGTTTIEAKGGCGMNESVEMKCLKALQPLNNFITVAPTYLRLHEDSPEFVGDAEDYTRWLCEYLLPKFRSRRLARFADVDFGVSASGPERARTYLQAARLAGLVPKVQAQLNAHSDLVAVAAECQSASADGLNYADSRDIQILATSHTIATLLPATVHQGSYGRFPPARELIDSGAAVALATGYNPGVSSTYSMQMAISLACTHMNMTPEEAVSSATINGAHAIQEAARCGSLEFGKRADVLMLNVSDYREIPYHFGVNMVALTMRSGRVAYRFGEVLCSGPS